MTRLLLVHGRAQGGKDAKSIEQEWIEALDRGYAAAGRTRDPSVSIDFPYYGDRLDELVEREGLPSDDAFRAKGPGEQGTDFENFLRSTLISMQEDHPALTDEKVEAVVPSEDYGAKGALNWRWVHAIARTIDSHWGFGAEFGIRKVLTDVYLYVKVLAARRAVDEIVWAKVTDEPTVVVGHSLGSVVSYNLLTDHKSLKSLRHVTVGSPLGIATIKSTLTVAANKSAHGWVNALDPDDIVALHPLDDDHFRVRPSITNFNDVANHTSNQHGIAGYLDDSRVAIAIDDALRLS